MKGSGAFFRQIVESSPDGIWAIDLTGRTIYANCRAAGLLGRRLADMQNLTVLDVLDEVGQEQFRRHLRHAVQHGPNKGEVECRYLRPDGSYAQVVVSEGGLRDDDGRLVGFVQRMADDEDRRTLIGELSRRQEQLDEAQSIARMGSFELDLDTGTLSWSREMYALFGEGPETAVASVATFVSWVIEEDRHLVRRGIEEALQGGGDHQMELRVRRRDGSVGWVRGRNRVTATDATGRPLRLGGTIQDITDVKEAEAQLLDAVGLNTLLQVVVTDANSSATVAEALGRIRAHLLEDDDWERAVGFVVDPEHRLTPYLAHAPESMPDPVERAVAARALAAQEMVIDETQPLSPRVGFVVALPGQQDAVVVLTGNGRIRRPWMVRAMIAQVTDQVRRVAERERDARELAAARDAAMEASRLKSDFLATMSHEIRTPMNGVIGLNELLLHTGLDEEQRRLARGVEVAGRTLLQLINDILDFSKIEAGELELEAVEFDLAELVAESAGLVRSSADERALALSTQLDPDVPRRLVGDPTRLGQILANLLSNAVKFTPQGGIEVGVTVVDRREDVVVLRFEVHDTGIGISRPQRERLFEPFRQADASTTRTYGGTGLGLAIVRRLVAALGGEVGVASSIGAGSTFWFTAPFRLAEGAAVAAPCPATEPEPQPDRGAEPGRVLVVEDNEINQMVALGLLEALGYTGAVAGNGAEAVDRLAREPFDAVLMDLRMPVMDGFTAARRIRADEGDGRRVPIIALTASAITGERERCLGAGMDDFLSKPVNREQLTAALRRHLSPAAARTVAADRATEGAPDTAAVGPVLDSRRLEELLAMGPRAVPIVERAVGNFVRGFATTLADLEAAATTADAPRLRDVAHKFKGSALNLGAKRVADLAFSLEQLGDTGATEAAAPVIDRLRVAAEETARALAAYEEQRRAG